MGVKLAVNKFGFALSGKLDLNTMITNYSLVDWECFELFPAVVSYGNIQSNAYNLRNVSMCHCL